MAGRKIKECCIQDCIQECCDRRQEEREKASRSKHTFYCSSSSPYGAILLIFRVILSSVEGEYTLRAADSPELQCPNGGGREQRGEKEVVSRTDDRDLVSFFVHLSRCSPS